MDSEPFTLDTNYRHKRKKEPICGNNERRLQKKLIDDYDWEPDQQAMFPEPPANSGAAAYWRERIDLARGPAELRDLRIMEAKAKYPDVLMIFRIGDFYELFYEDALTAAKTLGLTVTSRGSAAMAGFPYHQLEAYLQKLVASGYRVAVCEPIQ